MPSPATGAGVRGTALWPGLALGWLTRACGPPGVALWISDMRPLSGYFFEGDLWRDAEGEADVAGQFGTVERVEMQLVHAALDQFGAQLGADRGCQEILAAVARGLFEGIGDPGRDECAAAFGEAARAFPVFDRQDAGHDGLFDTRLGAGVAEAEKAFGFEEELGQRLGCAGIQLALQEVDVGLLACGLRMAIRVGAHADGEFAGLG